MSPGFLQVYSRLDNLMSKLVHQTILTAENNKHETVLRNPAVNAIFFERNPLKMGKVSRMKRHFLSPLTTS